MRASPALQAPSEDEVSGWHYDTGIREAPMSPEPFVSADEAAQFLAINRRYLLVLARKGIAGAYALGTGSKRKVWIFRLSELAASIAKEAAPLLQESAKSAMIPTGSPR